jgi:glycosyltransferase involved in cell wall biosynthesis
MTVSISVIVPSLNSAEFIGQALRSALAQSAVDFEIVVQDGGSTDSTHEVVRGLNDDRVRLIIERDDGQADALNRALSQAKGDWIIWLNADDLLAHDAFASAAEALCDSNDIVFGDWGLVDSAGRLFKHYTPLPLSLERLLARGAYVFSGGVFFRKSLLTERGAFDSKLHFCMDYDLFLRVVSDARIAQIPHDIGYLRSHPKSKSNSTPWSFFREHWVVARKHAPSEPRVIARLVASQLKMAAYLSTRPLWRSRLWLYVRPAKQM